LKPWFGLQTKGAWSDFFLEESKLSKAKEERATFDPSISSLLITRHSQSVSIIQSRALWRKSFASIECRRTLLFRPRVGEYFSSLLHGPQILFRATIVQSICCSTFRTQRRLLVAESTVNTIELITSKTCVRFAKSGLIYGTKNPQKNPKLTIYSYCFPRHPSSHAKPCTLR
jgi:hypothetical protein